MDEDTQASTLCMEAFEAARQEGQNDEAVQSLLLLAELNARQRRMSEAHILCEQARLYAEKGSPAVQGSLMLLCGRLAQAEARSEEATRWYMQATQILAGPDTGKRAGAGLAEAHSALARIAEASGHLEQASAHWKAAYQAVHPASGEV
jgi:tetratricopeptide (TPR) repeat protein